MNEVAATARRSFGIFLVSLFLLLVMMSYQVSDPSTGQSVLGAAIFRLFSPIQMFFSTSGHKTSETFQTYFQLTHANKENVRLKRELSAAKVKLALAERERQENERLRKILDLHSKLPYDMVVGEIVARDAKAFASGNLVINRGLRHGVKPEMPVVTANGVIGVIVLSAPMTAKVQVLSDASAAIGAMLAKNRVAGLVVGQGSGRCVLKYLPNNTTFNKGDVVITSGQEGIFPEGLPIGKVRNELVESTLYKAAELIPFEDTSALREVVILARAPLPPAPPPPQTQPAPPQTQSTQ